MNNFNQLNLIDSSFTNPNFESLRIDQPYKSKNYKRVGNEDLIGTKVDNTQNIEDIFWNTGITNNPEVLPIFTNYNEQRIECPNNKAILNTRTGKTISVVSNSYEMVKNDMIMKAIEPNLNFLDIEHVISMNNTARCFVTCAIKNNDLEVSEGDSIRRRLIFVNSFDGSYSFKVIQSDVRLWCFNQMGSIQNTKNKMVFRHQKGINNYLKNLGEFISYQRDDLSNSIEEFKEMKNTKCSSEMLKELFLHSFEDKLRGQIIDKETKQKRNKKFSDIENEFKEIKNFYYKEANNNEPNLYNAFNAITEYETHVESNRKDKTESARIRFENLIRGKNAERILKARSKALSFTR
nr:phage/plasmid-like protein TIGR03299 (TIGR03299) [uncultured Mediterranean phage uvMED]